MANEEQLAILKLGVAEWNEWRRLRPTESIDLVGGTLSDSDLAGANLSEADLSDANLSNANLSRANLIGAYLTGAHLGRANLSRANLAGAELMGADLRDADLTGAHLVKVNLSTADLAGADLTAALVWETIFANTDLNKTIGLDSCDHGGPSIIDHRTLLRSRLPLRFLRGCGLPDRVIDYLPSLLEAGPVQFYSCFISYSSANQAFVDRLHADLQNRGVRCWFAPHNMQPGQKIHEQIDEAIRVYDRLLVILSSESMASTWVGTEIARARKKEAAQNRRVLFPISIVPYDAIRSWELFDADLGKDSAREIREYFIPDFSQWKDHDQYTKAFDSLLKALKSADAAAGAPT